MKKQFILLFLLLFFFHNNTIFCQSTENLLEYPNYIISLNVLDADNIRILTATGEIFKTDYSFRNFEPVTKNNKFSYDFKFFNNNVGYCLGFSDSIYITSDAGKSWNSISINKKNHVTYSLLNLQLINSDALLLNCYKFNKNVNDIIDLKNFSGVIIKKNENEFNEVFSFPKGTISKIYSFDNNIYYAIGNNNLIARSYDGGSNWTTLTTKNNCFYNDVSFINENTGYFVGTNNDEGFISITYDGCKTWTYKELPESKNLKAIYAINKDSIIILGNDNKIYCSGDGCLNFSKVELGNDINTNLYCINKLDNKNLLFLASHPVEIDKEIVYTSTSVYKLNIDNFFKENLVKISPEKYKDDLIANMQTAAENEAASLHPASKIEKVSKIKINEILETGKSLTEEYEFSIKMRGAILGIKEFLVKIKVTGKIEFNIYGKIKYTTKELKVIYNEKEK